MLRETQGVQETAQLTQQRKGINQEEFWETT